MTSGAEPERVKTVRREHLKEILVKQVKQMIGNAATLAVACGMRGTEELEALSDSLRVTLDRYMREECTIPVCGLSLRAGIRRTCRPERRP
jgi:hypothetical protein